MSQNRRLHGEELDALYATKMAAWDNRRLQWEIDNVAKRDAESNFEWGTPAVMAAWRKGLRAEAIKRGLNPDLRDGEVFDVDTDGCLIQWNAGEQRGYNCGQTLEQFGKDNLSPRERQRFGLDFMPVV